MNDFLFTTRGKTYLLRHYVEEGKSTHVIANERETYPNLVRRALIHHGIALRNKAQAQAQALASGRHAHPTRGKPRPPETRERIGEAVSKSWAGMDASSRAARVRLAREQWVNTTQADRDDFRRLALEGLRRAACEGSRVERALVEGLKASGHHVETRTFVRDRPVDLLLREEKVAINVDGPGHFLPVWGESRLARVIEQDAAAVEALLAEGLTVVRVKNLARNLSEVQIRRLLTELLSVLQSERSGTPEVVELEVQ